LKRQVTCALHFVQARRIVCVLCQAPYTYLVRGAGLGQAEAGVAFADDAELQREARLKAMAAVDRDAGPQPVGRGRCPHCHQLQPWMALSAAGSVAIGAVVVLVLCAVVGIVGSEIWNWPTGAGLAGALALVGFVLVGIFAPRLADKPGPQPEDTQDPGYSDARFLGMLEENPSLRNWVLAQGTDLDTEVAWMSMGVLDLGEPKLAIPEGLSTEACSNLMNRL
jgi:hypothetical protein